MYSSAGRKLSLLILLMLPTLLLGSVSAVSAIDFNAYWDYRESGGDGLDTRSEFQQRYNLGAGPGVTLQPTHAISLGANLGYTRTERDVGRGMETFEEITPSGIVAVTNDIFLANLSGLASESRGDSGQELSSRSWDANLQSAWQRELWPTVRFNYGERNESSDISGGEVDFETDERRYSAGVDWDLRVAKMYYEYSGARIDDKSAGARSDSTSHFGRFETTQRLLQNRLSFNLAQQFQQTDSEVSLLNPGETEFALRLEGGQTFSALVNPLVGPDPTDPDFELTGNARLGDRNLVEAALTIDADQLQRRLHLGIRFDFEEQIDQLRLYIDPVLSSLSGEQVAALQWDLYTRNLLDTEWELAAAAIPATFDAVEQHVVLSALLRQRQVMVVATVPSGLSLVITEFEAASLLTGDVSSRQRNYVTNAGLRFQLTRTLAASSTLVLERNENATSGEVGDFDSESTRRNLSGSLRWTPTTWVAPSVGYNETLQTTTGAPDERNRSYSLIVATYPLPTLNVTLGATRTDRFTDDEKISTSDNYSLTSTARIYPDLTASLNSNFVIIDREQTAGNTATTEVFNSRLTMNARINPKLTADLTANYRHLNPPAADSTSASDTTLSFLYRPSDLLSMRLTGTRFWSGVDTSDILLYNLNLALLRTEITRLTFRYTHSRGDDVRNSFGLDGSWDISRSLYLQGRGDYSLAEVDRYAFQVSLALRL